MTEPDPLTAGAIHFQHQIFPKRREEFERLDRGQAPQALFLTCADSRIDPCLITSSKPGSLFVIRNAGNVVPPPGTGGGEAAMLEYAVGVLRVPHIVVCGHYECVFVAALQHRERIQKLPLISSWLTHLHGADRIDSEPDEDGLAEESLDQWVEANVRLQLEHLRTYPFVGEQLEAGALTLHGWAYRIGTGEIAALGPDDEFRLLGSG